MRHATGSATKSHLENNNLLAKQLGNTSLYVSEVGFGTYRVNINNSEHKDALVQALKRGVNLLDTSSNYAEGDAERLIGNTMHELFEDQVLTREQLVIVSKAGYIEGKKLKDIQKRSKSDSYPDIVDIDQNLYHCIHPDFLNDQLEDSLDRLQTSCIDVFLLHNPEYFKLFSQREGHSKDETDKIYYNRIKEAFTFLERAVEDGRIQYYGISSNTLPISDNDFMHTSLETCLDIASDISKHNHFKVVQFPLNLLETSAVTSSHSGNGLSTLAIAEKHHLGVLINRPLNAIYNQSVFRLVELEIEESLSRIEVEDSIEEFKLMEEQLIAVVKDYLESVNLADQDIVFDLSKLVESIWFSQPDVFYWKELLDTFLVPRVEHQLSLFSFEQSHDRVQFMIERYLYTLNQTVKSINAYFTQYHTQQTDHIKRYLNEFFPNLASSFGLANKSIRMIRQTSGVSSILIGMRRFDYVDDIFSELNTDIDLSVKANWQQLVDFKLLDD